MRSKIKFVPESNVGKPCALCGEILKDETCNSCLHREFDELFEAFKGLHHWF